MATYNFLDKTGLGQVWAKIKALIPTKTSDIQNDSGFITASDVPEEIFTITVSQEYDEQTETYVYRKDKTNSEIADAYEAKKQLVVADSTDNPIYSRGSVFRLRDTYAYNGYLEHANFINDHQELISIDNHGNVKYIDCLFNLHTYQSGIVEDYNHAWLHLWQAFTNGRAYIGNPQGTDRPPIIPSISMDWEHFVSASISFINDQGDIVRLSGMSETIDGTGTIVMNAAVLKNPLVVNITYDSQTETYSIDQEEFPAIEYAGSSVVCIYQDENYQNKYYYYDHTYSEQAPNNQTNDCIVFSSLGSVTQNNGALQANSDCFIISQINASGEPIVVTRTTFSQPIGGSTQSDWEEDDSTDDAYILNKPAIRAGDGENSVIIGYEEPEEDTEIYTIFITSINQSAKNYTFTTSDTLPSATNLKNYGVFWTASSNGDFYSQIKSIDVTNGTIEVYTPVSGAYASNKEAKIYYKNNQKFVQGSNSISEGSYNFTIGTSHSEGHFTGSYGNYVHTEGLRTIAIGSYSHAEGNNTIASSSGQHVQGKYNIEDTNGTYADIVGNGTSSARSNAYTLDWSGNGVYAGKVTVGAAPTNNMDVATKQYVDNAIPTVPTVTLNGSTTTTPSFYAPTTGGTRGYYLVSNGNAAPSWVPMDQPTIRVEFWEDDGDMFCDRTFTQMTSYFERGFFVYARWGGDVFNIENYVENSTITFANYQLMTNSGDITKWYITVTPGATLEADDIITSGYITHPFVTQTLSISSNVITLTGSNGSTSSITLPVYDGTVATGSTGATGGTS